MSILIYSNFNQGGVGGGVIFLQMIRHKTDALKHIYKRGVWLVTPYHMTGPPFFSRGTLNFVVAERALGQLYQLSITDLDP